MITVLIEKNIAIATVWCLAKILDHDHHNHHHDRDHLHHHHHPQHGAMQAAWLEPDLALLLPKIQGERQQWKRHQVKMMMMMMKL